MEYQTGDTNINNDSKQNGSFSAVVVVILIIIIGGAYFWYSRTANAPTVEQASPEASDEILRNDLQASGSIDIEEDMKGLDEEYQ